MLIRTRRMVNVVERVKRVMVIPVKTMKRRKNEYRLLRKMSAK